MTVRAIASDRHDTSHVDQDAGLAGRLAGCHLVPSIACGRRESRLPPPAPPPHRQRCEAGGGLQGATKGRQGCDSSQVLNVPKAAASSDAALADMLADRGCQQVE